MNNRFDQKAKELDSHPVIRDIALKFSQTLKKNVHISENMHLLDFGCGSSQPRLNPPVGQPRVRRDAT